MPHVVSQPEGAPKGPSGPRVTQPQNPQPTPSSISPEGRWMVYHARWQANLDLLPNKTFQTTSQGGGVWAFDGRNLTLKWAANKPAEILVLQADGTFYRMCPEGSFVMRKC